MAVVAEIRGRNSQLNTVVDQSKRKLGELRTAAAKGLGGGGLGVGFGFAALLGGLKQVTAEFDRIEKTSRTLRASVEETQRLNFLGSQNGVELQQIAKGLNEIDRRLGDIEKNPNAARALKRLGLEANAFAKLGAEERIFALAGAFEKSSDSAAAAADLYQLAGRNGQEFIKLLVLGEDALRDLSEIAPVVSEEDVKQITRMNDALDLLGKNVKAGAGTAASFIQDAGDQIGSTLGAALAGIEALLDGRGLSAAHETVGTVYFETLQDIADESDKLAKANPALAASVAQLAGAVGEMKRAADLAAESSNDAIARVNGEVDELVAALEHAREVEDALQADDSSTADDRLVATQGRLQVERELLERQKEAGKLNEAQAKLDRKAEEAAVKAEEKLAEVRARVRAEDGGDVGLLDLENEKLDDLEDRLEGLRRDALAAADLTGADQNEIRSGIAQRIADTELDIEKTLERQGKLREAIDDAAAEARLDALRAEEELAQDRLGSVDQSISDLQRALRTTQLERLGGRFEGSESLSTPLDSLLDRQVALQRDLLGETRRLRMAMEDLELEHIESQHG